LLRDKALFLMNHEVFMPQIRFLLILAVCLQGLAVGAQSAVPGAQAGPFPELAAPSAAPVQAIALQYDSVLAKYQPYTEQAVASWPDANATVQRIGGWRAYAKEIQAPASALPEPGAKP
jgi:hypothetical protein